MSTEKVKASVWVQVNANVTGDAKLSRGLSRWPTKDDRIWPGNMTKKVPKMETWLKMCEYCRP